MKKIKHNIQPSVVNDKEMISNSDMVLGEPSLLNQVANMEASHDHVTFKKAVKSKPKSKAVGSKQVDDQDDALIEEFDLHQVTESEPLVSDSFLLAQSTLSINDQAPGSVGEELLRQAGPLPNSVGRSESALAETGFWANWGMPIALGAGVGVLALASSGGGSAKSSNATATEPEDPVSTTYELTVIPMVGKFLAAPKIDIKIFKNGQLWKELDHSSNPNYVLLVERSELNPGDVLQLVIVNGDDAHDYTDISSGQKVNLGESIHAWVVVPAELTSIGKLNLAVTPLTELAHLNLGLNGEKTFPSADNILASNNAVAKAFGLQSLGGVNVDLVLTKPALTSGDSFKSADAASQKYGQALALFSSLANNFKSVSNLGPTPESMRTALKLLLKNGEDADPGNFALSADALSALGQAAIDYNKIASGANKLITLPGIHISDEVADTDGVVSLYKFDTTGLKFQLYAPYEKKAGDEIQILFEVYGDDGEPRGEYLYVHTLKHSVNQPIDPWYPGEIIELPRFIKNNDNLLDLRPVTDSKGASLQGIGAPNDENPIVKYRVSIKDSSGVLVVQQDFSIDFSPVSIQNVVDPTFDRANAQEGVEVHVVLDQDVQWNAAAGDESPKLEIWYPAVGGELKSKVGEIKDTGYGRVLKFTFDFSAEDQANGFISLKKGALTGTLRDPVGFVISTPLVDLVNTTFTKEQLFVDTVLPPSVILSLSSSVKANSDVDIGGGAKATFINNICPDLDIRFINADGSSSETLPGYEKEVVVQLFAYPDGDPISKTLVATVVVKAGDSAEFKKKDYNENWLKTLDADGQAYRFYAKVIDLAGNEAPSEPLDSNLMLWLDTQAPLNTDAPVFDTQNALNFAGDPMPDDAQTNDTQPGFIVTGEASSKVKLYKVSLNSDGSVSSKEELSISGERLSGVFGQVETGRSVIKPIESLSDGLYHFATTLTDMAGNESELSQVKTIRIKTSVSSEVTLTMVDLSVNDYFTAGQIITIEAKFNEAVYFAPGSGENPFITFKNKVGGKDLRADYASGAGTDALRFTYTVPADGVDDSGKGEAIQFTKEGVSFFNANHLVDLVGNALQSNPTITLTPPEADLVIDTLSPSAPIVSQAAALGGSVSKGEALEGIVSVTAEAGSRVKVTFTSGEKSIDRWIEEATGESQLLALTQQNLSDLGISDVNNAQLNIRAQATDAAGNTSQEGRLSGDLILDTMAPRVIAAMVGANTPPVIAHEGGDVNVKAFSFLLTFSEALDVATVPNIDNFLLLDSKGASAGDILRVEHESANSYRVTVRPKINVDDQVSLKIIADVASANPLKDAAGNAISDVLLNTGDGLSAQQMVDSVRPTVSVVIDNVEATITNGPVVFTLTFSEAVQAVGDLRDTFVVTNGVITSVEAVAGSSNQYRVAVNPHANIANGELALSIKPSMLGGFVDTNGNSYFAAGSSAVSLVAQGGVIAIDTSKPAAPVLTLVHAADEILNFEKISTAFTLTAEPSSRVELTFNNGDKQIKKTIVASGSADPVSLTDLELSALGLINTNAANLSVSAVATDQAGNSSETSSVLTVAIDTNAPTVKSVTDQTTGVSGPSDISFSVVFSEVLAHPPTVANFVLKDPSLGTVQSVEPGLSSNTYIVVVRPTLGKVGNLSLVVNGDLADTAGNSMSIPLDLSELNSQPVDTVSPVVVSVVDNITAEYANAMSTVVYTIQFDKALSADLTPTMLREAFTDDHGEVLSVVAIEGTNNTSFNVSVKPTPGQEGVAMGLNVLADRLQDALGNKVAAWQQTKDHQKIDTKAPLAPEISLSASADTGEKGDNITSINSPLFDLKGLEVGAMVSIFNGSQKIFHGLATDMDMTAQVVTVLADGSYTDIRVSQTDAQGNVGAFRNLGELVIQSTAPGPLSNLVFDAEEDTKLLDGTILTITNGRDYRTDRPTPTFTFNGGTVGSEAVLFLDKDKDGLLDEGEELGRTTIRDDERKVSVNPLNALQMGTYSPSSILGQISILEINAAGLQGGSTQLQLLNVMNGDGSTSNFQGLTIRPALPQAIRIESAETSRITNTATLNFNVTDGGQRYGTITVVADATTGGTTTSGVVLGTAASPDGSGPIAINVGSLATAGEVIYTNFRAYQSYAKVNSSTVDVVFSGGSTANSEGITLDHSTPMLSSIEGNKSSLYKDETAELTFTFNKAITGFSEADIRISGGGSVTNLLSLQGGKVWIATYTPVADSTAPVTISVNTSEATFKDLAGNSPSATTASMSMDINTMLQVAPVITVPDSTLDSGLVVGVPFAIDGINAITVDDLNNNVIKVVLTVSQGTLIVAPTSEVSFQGDGTPAHPLILTAINTGALAKDALNAALATLKFTAASMDDATITIVSHDTAVGPGIELSGTASLILSNIASAPMAPVNELPSLGLDQAETAIVAGRAFSFTGHNLIEVSDVNDDIIRVSLSVNQGTLSIEPVEGVSILGSGSNTLIMEPQTGMTGPALTAALNTALSQLVYIANGSIDLEDTLTIVSTDATGRQDTDTVVLSVNAVPISPINNLPSTAPEGIITGLARSIGGVSVADDDHNIAFVKLSTDHGSLSIETTTGVSMSGNGSVEDPLVLTPSGISGEAATAAINAALAKLIYTATPGFVGFDTLNVLTTDSTGSRFSASGPLSASNSLELTVNALPIAPINTVPNTPMGVITGQAFGLSGIQVEDEDENLASVTLSVEHGQLNVADLADSGVSVTGNHSNTLKLVGANTTKINTVLGSLVYTAVGGYTGVEKLTITTEDSTDSRLGGVLSDRDELTFTVFSEPVSPVNLLPTSGPRVQASQATFIEGIRVEDADNNLVSVQLTVKQGVLNVTSGEGVTVENNGTSSVTLNGNSATAINTVLASLSYIATSGFSGEETLTIVTRDSTQESLGGARSDSDELVFRVMAAPVNTLIAPGVARGGLAVNLSGLNVVDLDNNLSVVVLSVSDGVLSSSTNSAVVSSDGGKTLTIAGDLVAINAALASLSYKLENQLGKQDVILSMTSTDVDGLTDVDEITFDVARADDAVPTGSVAVSSSSGNFVVGATLTADASSLADANGLGAFSYQWSRTVNGVTTDITAAEGGAGTSYTLSSADVGATLNVQVSYIDGANYANSVSSDVTSAVHWPDSLVFGLGSNELSFKHNLPGNFTNIDSGTTSASSKFIALQEGRFYVLDVDGDNAITNADKTTYLDGMTNGFQVTTANGVSLQLLSVEQWGALKTALDGTLPAGWSTNDDAATASYWTRDVGETTGTHKVFNFGAGEAASLLDDYTSFDWATAYRYNVFQVI